MVTLFVSPSCSSISTVPIRISPVIAGAHPAPGTLPGDPVPVAWMLDRVVASSGNYFELHYNFDEADSNADTFRTKGILITSIAYTGHTSGLEYDESGRVTAVGDDPPFHT